ncbi:hypothetical protein LQZ18_18395 [Lachnospiraceae bacterium ZAX-1]
MIERKLSEKDFYEKSSPPKNGVATFLRDTMCSTAYRNVKHEQAYEQLSAYLDSKHATVGYLVTFDFHKDANRQPKAEWVEFKRKRIFDVMLS